MKKTMIALATIAAMGTASAQVTITGGISVGMQSNLAKVAGIAMTDNTLYIGASEDLGGGLKAAAAMTIENDLYRGAAFTRADQSISLTTPVGAFAIAQTRSSGNIGSAVIGPVSLQDDQWTSAVMTRTPVDVVKATFPVSSAISLTVAYVEGGNNAEVIAGNTAVAAATTAAAAKLAVAAAVKASNAASGGVTPAAASWQGVVKYSGNGLTVTGAMTSTSYTDDTLALLATAAAAAKGDIQTTSTDLSVIYDAGVAKLGFAYDSSRRGKTSADKSAMIFGLSVPMGAITVGGNYGSRDEANFLQLGAQYDLSKRTNVNASWGQDKQGAGKDTNSQYRLSLNHSF